MPCDMIISKKIFVCNWNRRWLMLPVAFTVVTLCYMYFSVIRYRCMPTVSQFQLANLRSLEPPVRSDRRHVRPKIIYDHSHFISSDQDDFYVDNCLVTRNPEYGWLADAVAITWRRHVSPSQSLPSARFSWQRWVWVMLENPFHSGENLTAADGIFNWTMTYRKESDVYVPYGSYERREKPEPVPSHIGSQHKIVSVVISNNIPESVHNGRYDFVMKLMKYIPVAIYGKLGEPCEGYVGETEQQLKPCPLIKDYLFYLALENSNCKEYITEKVFANAFESGVVPVVLGASKGEYEKVLPPNSFIYVRDFPSVENLAEYLMFLSTNATEYLKYHSWREHYRTSYRILYHIATIWKPLCDALNNDDDSESIKNISTWWTVKDCEKHTATYEETDNGRH